MGQIDAKEVTPIFPYGQESFGNWLFNQIGYNPETQRWEMTQFPSYPGSSVASPDTTRLNDVQGQWSPQGGAGQGWLESLVQNNGLGVGQGTEIGNQLMNWGSMGGPGGSAMMRMKDWGSPSEDVNNFLRSMAITGTTNPDTGLGLQRFMQGSSDGAANFAAPFLMGGVNSAAGYPAPGGPTPGPSYHAPMIQGRQIQRRA